MFALPEFRDDQTLLLFRFFKTSRGIIRLAVMLYIRFPLSLWKVEYLQYERGIEISCKMMGDWWERPKTDSSSRRNGRDSKNLI